MQQPLNIQCTSSGKYRVFNWGNPMRVWIGTSPTKSVFPDTIMTLRDAQGNVDEALAGDLTFDNIKIQVQ